MKPIHFLVVIMLVTAYTMHATDDDGYCPAPVDIAYDPHTPPEHLVPLFRQAGEILQQEYGTLTTFRRCVRSTDFLESEQRSAYLAGAVVERWHDLRKGSRFLSAVKKQAGDNEVQSCVRAKSLKVPLKTVFASSNPAEFKKRLTCYAGLFKAMQGMEIGEYYDRCSRASCFHNDLAHDAQAEMHQQIVHQVLNCQMEETYLFDNEIEHNAALTCLFQAVGITDSMLKENRIRAQPLSDTVACKLWQVQQCIIKDDAVGFLDLMRKDPELAFYIFDATGYSLFSTATNIHMISDRHFYIDYLIMEDCTRSTADLQRAVDTTMRAILQQKNSAESIKQLATLYQCIKEFRFNDELQQLVEIAIESVESTCRSAELKNISEQLTLLRRAVQLTR